MMVMFGQIFQVATESVTKQRTMADNDQNTRTFVTIMRADLDKRTSRSMVPFFPGELAANPGTPFQIRKGYFYLNNNNLTDRTDDVLQFAMLSTVSMRNADETQYFGRAEALNNPLLPSGTPPLDMVNFIRTPNQPDRDDGQVTANEAGASRAAEVCYWMRGGKLYRRVMLIRDPIPAAGVDPAEQSQPKYQNPANGLYFDYFAPTGVYATTPSPVFFRDFDYSAHAVQIPPAMFGPNRFKPAFNGMETLSNEVVPTNLSLGQSWNRFGFDNHDRPPVSGTLTYGLPREFAAPLPAAPATPPDFIGRFTHEETSSAGFEYPQSPGQPTPAAITNWMDASNVAPLNADGVVTGLAGGPRVGVDLLLSHVHEFRVEAWDQRLNDFAPIGHNRTIGGVPGDFHFSRRLNATYGPLATGAPPFGPNIFDTWHPAYDRNYDGLGNAPDRPPFRPVNFDPTGVSGPNSTTTNPSGSGPYWTINTNYQVGDVIFPQPGEDLNFNGYLDPGEDGANGFPADGNLQERVSFGAMYGLGELTDDANGNGVLDPGEDGTLNFPVDGQINRRSLRIPYFPTGMTFAYRCIRAGTSGPTRLNEPNWSSTVGYIQRDPSGNGPDWIVDYNARPLRAIRITVRFEHPTATSKQMKQVTIVHSLRDTTSVP